MNQLFTRAQIANLKYNGTVPHITEKPVPEEYGLSGDPKEKIKELEDMIEKPLERKAKIISITLCIVYFFALGFAVGRTDIAYFIYAYVFSFFLIPLIVYWITWSKIRKKKENNLEIKQLKEGSEAYEDDLLAYDYWQIVSGVEYWNSLDGHQFEQAVAMLMRKLGYSAVVSRAGGDGGIDIVLSKEGEPSIAVQCKAHSKAVAPSVARDLLGTMVANGFEKGLLVSKSGFTSGVIDFVKDKPISLMDLENLISLMQKTAD